MAVDLPLDVISDILVCLPVKSLLRFKCACKEWFNLINDPLFINTHHQKSLDNYAVKPSVVFLDITDYPQSLHFYLIDDLDSQPTQLAEIPIRKELCPIGSYNGLLCFVDSVDVHPHFFLICNPSTRAFKEISVPLWLSISMGLWTTSKLLPGFGYDCENDDYKIIVLATNSYREDMYIYSLKLSKWTYQPLSMVDFIVDPEDFRGTFALFMNKRLHWIVQNRKGHYEIARFNLCSEQWDKPLSQLPIDINPQKSTYSLACLDGCLCLHLNSDASMYGLLTHIWIMKEYGVAESWTELVTMSRKSYVASRCSRMVPTGYSKTKSKLMFWKQDGTDHEYGLVWYNMKQKTFKEFRPARLHDGHYYYSNLVPYAESLVSIPGSSISTHQITPSRTIS